MILIFHKMALQGLHYLLVKVHNCGIFCKVLIASSVQMLPKTEDFNTACLIVFVVCQNPTHLCIGASLYVFIYVVYLTDIPYLTLRVIYTTVTQHNSAVCSTFLYHIYLLQICI